MAQTSMSSKCSKCSGPLNGGLCPACSANSVQVGGTHYQDATGACPSCGAAIQHWDLFAKMPYLVGQVCKYVLRFSGKNGKQDLEKAGHFLKKLVEVYYPEWPRVDPPNPSLNPKDYADPPNPSLNPKDYADPPNPSLNPKDYADPPNPSLNPKDYAATLCLVNQCGKAVLLGTEYCERHQSVGCSHGTTL